MSIIAFVYAMLVPLSASGADAAVKAALETLKGNLATVIPIALGVSILAFGARFLWSKARGLVR